MLVSGSVKTAEAAITVAPTFTAPLQAAGLTETWVVSYTSDTTLAAGGVINVKFPTSFGISAVTTAKVTLGGALFTGVTDGAVAVNPVTGVIAITTATATTTAGIGTITITGIVNPTATTTLTAGTGTATATQGFTVQTTGTTADAEVAAAAAPQIFSTAATKSPTTSVQADGASTVAVTFTTSNAGTLSNTGSATGLVYTATTDVGTITTTPTAAGTGFGSIVAVTTPVTSVSAASVAAMTTGATLVVTIKAPTAAGTSTVILRATPATGGQAVIIGSTSITWTTATTTPGAVASASMLPTTAVTVSTTGTSANITATFLDANGNSPIPGGAVTVNTNMGVLANVAGAGTCTNQACSGGTLATDGKVTVTLAGGGVVGTATVTFTVGGVSTTKSVTITGPVATMTAVIQADADAGGTGTVFVNTATPGAASFTAGVRIAVDPKDSSGNRVSGVSPVITASPSGCVTVGATTASTSTVAARITLTAGNGTTGSTCTLTATSGTKTATASLVIGAALASTSTLEIAAVDMAIVSNQTVTVTVKSSTDALVQDGTSVTMVVSAGAVATATAFTANGVATFTYVSPGTAQQVNLTAIAGLLSASKAISVGAVTPTPSDGSLTAPTFGTGNVGSAVFDGGTSAQLSAAVTAAGGTSVWAQTSSGTWVRYNTLAAGATAFVNNAFNEAFVDGFAGPTAVFVVK